MQNMLTTQHWSNVGRSIWHDLMTEISWIRPFVSIILLYIDFSHMYYVRFETSIDHLYNFRVGRRK